MSRRIVKNVGSGLIAQAWTIGLGLIALPILVRGLGAERYGLLSLSLALVGFAAVADLGVGRAASKFIAEDYERNEVSRTQHFVATALTVSTTMGVLGSLLLLLLSPVLALHTFDIRIAMQPEAKKAFALTAAGLTAVLLRILFDGVLAGHHHIAFLSFANMLANTLKAGLSIVVILRGYSVLAIIGINVIVCYLQAGYLCYYTYRVFSGRVRIWFGWNAEIARQLLGLGIISTVSWLLANVIFLYADRFIIGMFFPLALIGYYTTAFDISSKQWYISNSISQAFFPVFSGKAATSERELQRSYINACKATAILVTGVTVFLITFDKELLTYWIGSEFAIGSSVTLRVLALGILLSAYISIPYTAIIAGAARPGICVRIFVVAIALHVALSLWWLHLWGIVGVALAFVGAYLFAFVASTWWVSRQLIRMPLLSLWRQCFLVPWTAAATCGTICWFIVKPMVHDLLSVAVALVVAYLSYLGLCAVFAYDSSDRRRALVIAAELLRFRPEGSPVANESK